MSIASAEPLPDYPSPLYLAWLGVAFLLAMGVGALRRPGYLIDRRESVRLVPMIAAAAMLTFVTWLLVQLAYGTALRIIAESTGREPKLTHIETAVLSVVSPLIGIMVARRMIGRGEIPEEIGLKESQRAAFLPALLTLLIVMPIVQLTLVLTRWVLYWRGVPHPDAHPLIEMLTDPQPWVRLLIVISATIMAPIFEELLFRGLVQTAFRKATHMPWLAILVSSTLFALVHPLWTMPAIFVLSIFIGILYERTRNLWAAMFIHAMFNAFSLATSYPYGR